MPKSVILHLAVPAQEHVLRADVAVHDAEGAQLLVATPVRVVEALGDLRRDVDAELLGDGIAGGTTPSQERREIDAGHVLHRHEVARGPARSALFDLAQIEDLHHVRMAQPHGELGLVDEHVDEAEVLRKLGKDPLDDERLLEPLDAEALRLEDLRHAATPQPLEQLVAAVRRRPVRLRAAHGRRGLPLSAGLAVALGAVHRLGNLEGRVLELSVGVTNGVEVAAAVEHAPQRLHVLPHGLDLLRLE